MEVYFYKLKFQSPVHFGETGIYLENIQETISSDSLFSALINVVATYYGREEADSWLNLFKETPPFLLSSLFIYNKDKYFLPKPLEDSFISKEIKQKMGKELKKLKTIEATYFLKWLNKNPFEIEDIQKMSKSSESSYPYKKEIRPRVTLDRITQQSSIYFCGILKFEEDAGLWGLVAFKNKSFIEKFKIILNLLGQTGIGGEKTYGYGMFNLIEFKPVDGILNDIVNTKSDYFTLLSLYHPSEKDNAKEKLISYNLIRKKGWITSGRYALPLKRKSVGFITEGSILKEPATGMLVDVTPDYPPPAILNHRVYRYGYAFTVPLKEI
jgi:CRISPR-associated protein Csm4